MKKILFAFLLLILSYDSFSQNAYYDAINLRKYVGRVSKQIDGLSGDPDGFVRILRNYVPNSDNMTDPQVMKYLDSINPFLDTLIASGSSSATGSSPKARSGILSSIAGIDVTNIVNGISMLMIERAKQELTITFFNRFKEFASDYPEFQILFPRTADNLENLLSFQYPEMLPTLRTGFFEDLKKITYHLDDVLELPRYSELLKNFPEIRVVIRSIRIVHEIESGYSHPAEVIENFSRFPEWYERGATKGFNNLGNCLKLAAIFSQSLRNDSTISGDGSKAWVTMKDIKRLVTDPTTLRIYLGLIYQLSFMQDIKFYHGADLVSFHIVMAKQSNNFLIFENKLTEFIELAGKVDKAKKEIDQKQSLSVELTNDDLYSYINTSIDIIEYGFDLVKVFDERFITENYTRIARQCNNLYRHIYKAEYSQAISDAMGIFNGIRELTRRENLVQQMTQPSSIPISGSLNDTTAIDRTIPGTSSPQDSALLVRTRAVIKADSSLRKFNGFVAKATKYGLFMANVVDAKTPEEVQSVLENAILPVGSSSIKKNSDFNISIQSYLGAFGRIGSIKRETGNAWSDRFGVSAPIGVSVTPFGWGKAGSLSVFASLLDLGAIVDYQLRKDSVPTSSGGNTEVLSKDYKIELGQIFSPGAYIVYGFPWNIPLSFGVGTQYGPGLSKIDSDNNTIINNPQWRFNVFLSVDITFFTIKNVSRPYFDVYK